MASSCTARLTIPRTCWKRTPGIRRDLVGLEARLAEGNGLGLPAGQVIGKVVDVLDSAQTLLKIRLVSPVRDSVTGEVTESTALVPFVDELVPDIDLEEGYLTIDPPGGLIPGL